MRLVPILVMLGSVALDAQTHPCDQPPPPPTTVASGAPHRLQFCSPAADQIEAAVIILDTLTFDLLPVTARTGMSATGMVLYETGLMLQVSRGVHVLTVATYNRDVTGALQVGPPSDPFTYTAVDETPLPTRPVIHGVSR